MYFKSIHDNPVLENKQHIYTEKYGKYIDKWWMIRKHLKWFCVARLKASNRLAQDVLFVPVLLLCVWWILDEYQR